MLALWSEGKLIGLWSYLGDYLFEHWTVLTNFWLTLSAVFIEKRPNFFMGAWEYFIWASTILQWFYRVPPFTVAQYILDNQPNQMIKLAAAIPPSLNWVGKGS